MTIIMGFIQIIFGLAFIIIGILLIFIDKLCNEKIKAVYSPQNAIAAFVFKRNGKEIIAYPMNLYLKNNQVNKGEEYEVYICKYFPKLLIFSKEIPKIQYVLAISAIMMGIMFIVCSILANFIL